MRAQRKHCLEHGGDISGTGLWFDCHCIKKVFDCDGEACDCGSMKKFVGQTHQRCQRLYDTYGTVDPLVGDMDDNSSSSGDYVDEFAENASAEEVDFFSTKC